MNSDCSLSVTGLVRSKNKMMIGLTFRTVDTFSILVRRVLSVGPSGTMCFVINAIEEGKARVSQREMTRGKIDKN